MNKAFIQTIETLKQRQRTEYTTGIRRGIEREALRITADGLISQQPHFQELGSALTHPWLTTDYSEALLEFITPPEHRIDTTIQQLGDLHKFALKQMNSENLWPLSMPGYIPSAEDINIAHYGKSNIGRMKRIYRMGLKNRYGSMMQSIAGIHFNLSFPDILFTDLASIWKRPVTTEQDFKSECYLGLIRNFKRYVWLLIYLFGASPVLCKTFLQGKNRSQLPLQTLSEGSLYLPQATALRLSDLGYTNSAQSNLQITYNSITQYVQGLRRAINTPSAQYESFGVVNEGKYKQLNSNVLQIENEFYSTIRPKRVTNSGEKPTDALAERGIEYIEVRALDLNPFSSVGITKSQIKFLDLFLTYCLIQESPNLDWEAQQETEQNLATVIKCGRQANLTLYKDKMAINQQEWAESIFSELTVLAEWFDLAQGNDEYQQVIAEYKEQVTDSDKTLSGLLMRQLESSDQEQSPWGVEQSKQYSAELLAKDYAFYTEEQLIEQVKLSHEKQKEIEANDNKSFDLFLKEYFEKS